MKLLRFVGVSKLIFTGSYVPAPVCFAHTIETAFPVVMIVTSVLEGGIIKNLQAPFALSSTRAWGGMVSVIGDEIGTSLRRQGSLSALRA